MRRKNHDKFKQRQKKVAFIFHVVIFYMMVFLFTISLKNILDGNIVDTNSFRLRSFGTWGSFGSITLSSIILFIYIRRALQWVWNGGK